MVTEARARGWEELENGELLNKAEASGFGYQQNLAVRKIAIVVLGLGRWSLIRHHVAQVVAAVKAATPGSFAEVDKRANWRVIFRFDGDAEDVDYVDYH